MKHKVTAHLVPQDKTGHNKGEVVKKVGNEGVYRNGTYALSEFTFDENEHWQVQTLAICDEQAEIKEGISILVCGGLISNLVKILNNGQLVIHPEYDDYDVMDADQCLPIICAYTLPNIPTISKEMVQVILDNPSVKLEVEMVERCCTGTINGVLQSPDCNHTCSIWSYATDAHGNIDVRVVEESTSMFDDSPYGQLLDAAIDNAPVEDKAKITNQWMLFDVSNPPEINVRILAYHAGWVDEDYNIEGIRFGYITDDGFYGLEYNNEQDCWDEIIDTPQYWMPLPKFKDTAASKDLFTREDVEAMYDAGRYSIIHQREDASFEQDLSDYITNKNK